MWLREDTAVTVKIGPFVDDTDGHTAEVGLAIAQADVRLSKNGGNMAQKNEASACTHDEIGWYDCDLDTTDTNTAGRLVLMVDEAGALPVWHEYVVIPADTYDSLLSATGLAPDIADQVWDEQVADHQTVGSFGEAQSLETIADNVWDEIIESGAPVNARTARQLLRIIASVDAGITANVGDWSALSLDETKTRISVTLDASGNRTARSTLDGS